VAQRPFTIPSKYEEAVREEITSLVKAGLIEPGHSDWASPVFVIVKLNAATEVDTGLLGDQADILEGFMATHMYHYAMPPVDTISSGLLQLTPRSAASYSLLAVETCSTINEHANTNTQLTDGIVTGTSATDVDDTVQDRRYCAVVQ
jgi:hypothetical protein